MNKISIKETNRIARRTFRTFTRLAGRDRLSTWGACGFRASADNGTPAMRFEVEALHFQGTVEIAYDRNNDLYDISLLKNGCAAETRKGVNIYLAPTLVNSMVEKPLDWDDEEYARRINEWRN